MRLLVTGAGGQVGSEVAALIESRDASFVRRRARPAARLDVLALDHDALDVANRDAVMAAAHGYLPDVVIHAAAWTAVDACETDPDRAFAVNAIGTRHVAEACRATGAHLVYLSTDYVFDGTSARAYHEWDDPAPRSVYGRSKLGGEREAGPGATIVRTSWVCGRRGANMVKTVLRLWGSGSALRFVDDQRGSPTVARDLAATIVELAVERRPGLFHVTNRGATTWFGLARAVVAFAGGDPSLVEPISAAQLDPPRPAPRPANSVLDNAALRLSGLPLLPDWEESIAQLVEELLAAQAR